MTSFASPENFPRYHRHHEYWCHSRGLLRSRQHPVGHRAGAGTRGSYSHRLARSPVPADPPALLAGGHARGARHVAARAAAPGPRSHLSCGARHSRGWPRRWATKATMAHEAFVLWHAARNQCEPYRRRRPGTRRNSRRVTGSPRSAMAMPISGRSASRTISKSALHAAALGFAKPDVRAYRALADALTLQPAEILFVGDEPHADVAGPRNAGMQTVWVNRGANAWPARRCLPPTMWSPTSTSSWRCSRANCEPCTVRRTVSTVHRRLPAGGTRMLKTAAASRNPRAAGAQLLEAQCRYFR